MQEAMFKTENKSFSAAGEPFPSVQSAWFWFAKAWSANTDGARFRSGSGSVERPCEPLDIMCVVDRLYRSKVLTKNHLKVMTHYGSRGHSPRNNTGKQAERIITLWNDGMRRLETALIDKGIVSKEIIRAV